MTLAELYESIDGSYEQARRTLRVDKLIDKHIRKLTTNGVLDNLIAAGRGDDATQIFECAHAAKGICGNLGLTSLAEAASEVSEEFRPGNPRKLSDQEVAERIDRIEELYARAKEGIERYAQG